MVVASHSSKCLAAASINKATVENCDSLWEAIECPGATGLRL